MRGGGDGLPLLRGVTAQTLAGVTGEDQVLVFAERVRCLRQLAATLRDRHGVEAHVADGSLRAAEFAAALKQRFSAGEFPILCLYDLWRVARTVRGRRGESVAAVPAHACVDLDRLGAIGASLVVIGLDR